MTKTELLMKLNGIKYDINCNSYIEEYDGDDEYNGRIIRKIFTGMTEEDTKEVLKLMENLIELIKRNDING